jgi:Arc/MetJ-type ribon-helix-helix transcriptional regulator
MIPIQVRITRKIIEEIDLLVQKGIYSNRSEFIRDATRRHVMSMGDKR